MKHKKIIIITKKYINLKFLSKEVRNLCNKVKTIGINGKRLLQISDLLMVYNNSNKNTIVSKLLAKFSLNKNITNLYENIKNLNSYPKKISYSTEICKLFRRAVIIAKRLNKKKIRNEHLLLAIIEMNESYKYFDSKLNIIDIKSHLITLIFIELKKTFKADKNLCDFHDYYMNNFYLDNLKDIIKFKKLLDFIL